jgi:NOL1/NOP2/sun family putative RNA methylase
MTSLERLYQRLATQLGDEYDEFRRALQAGYARGLRVNTLKLSSEDFLRLTPYAVKPVPWCPEGFTLTDPKAKPATHPFYAAGLYYLQDPSAMLAAHLLAPAPGEWVLDLCAAPGGKATHLAARMENEGVLVVNEINPRRAVVLAGNLERLGVTNALVLNESPQRLSRAWGPIFHRVLVDAPCSGEASLVRSPKELRYWSENTVRRFARIQSSILAEAAKLVRPGGWLLYGTCSFSPEENEGVVSSFLRRHADFEIVDLRLASGFDRGHPEWLEDADSRVSKAIRLWPHRGPGHGHFYALLQRTGGELSEPRWRVSGRLEPEAWRSYQRFCEENLTTVPARRNLVQVGEEVYCCPLPKAAWASLRVLRPGWWLGRIREKKFIPDHALAMALTKEQALRVHHMSFAAEEVRRYLQGNNLPGPWDKGWVLVTVEGFPIGWAEANAGQLNNRLPYHVRAANRLGMEVWG